MEVEFIKTNIDPRQGEILDPDMTLMCIHCGNEYKPYNNLVIHNYAFMGFCSTRCFERYNSLTGRLWRAIKYPFWWVRSRFMIWNDARYAAPCPGCGEPMMTMTKELQCCMEVECDEFAETYVVRDGELERLE